MTKTAQTLLFQPLALQPVGSGLQAGASSNGWFAPVVTNPENKGLGA